MASSIHRPRISKETRYDVQDQKAKDRVERKRVTDEHLGIVNAFGRNDVNGPVEDYMQRHVDDLDKAGKQERTLLHQLVEEDVLEEGRGRELLEWLVINHPKLLLKEDENGKTALHVAAKKCGEFLQCIFSQGLGRLPMSQNQLELKKILKQALVKKCNSGETCLHDAVRNEDCATLLQQMIELSGANILKETNNNLQTPLHFAVQPHPSFEVVKKLIELCPDAMFCKDKERMTPYQCLASMDVASGEVKDILDLFKYHCVRTKSRREIREYLYAGSEG